MGYEGGFAGRPDETAEWLNYLQPEGLVVGANVLRERGLSPLHQSPLDTEDAARALGLDDEAPREGDREFTLADPWAFFASVLGWPESHVAGSPGGPPVPETLAVPLAEHETLLLPDMAVNWRGAAPAGVLAQALVMLHPTLDPDGRGQLPGWEASPHQRLERLVRETGVGVGVLVARNALRLLYAPKGETAGWITWPLAALGRVEGRPMLAGLKLVLGRNAFFTGPAESRLRSLLEASREAQNEVSEKLSGQVLGALHELLRGLHRADPSTIERLAETDPHHLYEGLLTCLMRLVFLLYAEDRDLLPSSTEPKLRLLYESGYSVKTLYARLLADEALNPDTMDERRGGWGQLLALFRLVHGGWPDWIAARGGKLFDPDAFPFLEGRERGSSRDGATVLPVGDGTLLRILHGLMTVEGRGHRGEKVRERLSYRSLDVESIGSVYETVMGFSAARATEPTIALRDEKKLPTFVGLDSLLAEKAASREKWLKERSIKLTAGPLRAVKEAADLPALVAAFGKAVDERASPDGHPIGAGAPYLQPTEERRRSGSHYTPRSLTEPIVRHALEPAFARIGPDAAPESVLALKVCDPACGSGAFLVEACRQLGSRLEAAWDRHPTEKPSIPADEDQSTHARRLVAQRSLYGVDRNPMAVDLARLSLWLATLARDHEFTFLDHALKSGDSLVGLSRDEIAAANWDASKPGLPLFRQFVAKRIEAAVTGREAIRTAPDGVARALQEARHRRVEHEVDRPRDLGDATVAAFFAAEKPKAREAERQRVEAAVTAGLDPDWDGIAARARMFHVKHGWRPFHWQLEFPEVFARDDPGFDAIVGNPPFAGKNTISAGSGPLYLPWLQQLHAGAHGNADLAAHFYRRAFSLIRQGGAFGFIASNTIKQGDTRESGLRAIIAQGGSIMRATTRHKWRGTANVVTSFVHIRKGAWASPVLDGKQVPRISAYLVVGDFDDTPARLAANAGKAFQGSILLGMGFTFDDAAAAKGEAESLDTMRALIARDPRNAERIKPYIGGEEVNTSPTHAHHRYAIDFEDFPLRRDKQLKPWARMTVVEQIEVRRTGVVPADYEGAVAADWPDLLEIVERRVKPDRDKQDRKALRERWWQYGEKRPGLIRLLDRKTSVLGVLFTAQHFTLSHLATQYVFANSLNLLDASGGAFSTTHSRIHEVWAWFFSSTMEDRLRYSLSDALETFPFPEGYEIDLALEEAGRRYHDHRAALMIATNEGMTKTYNCFHRAEEPSTGDRGAALAILRDLHAAMDRAVLRAYGWHDLADTLAPEFLTPETEDDHTYQGRLFWNAAGRDAVLARLLALNARRHAEEVAAGLAKPGKARRAAAGEEDGA